MKINLKDKSLWKKIGITASAAAILGVTVTLAVRSTPDYMGGIQRVTFFSQSPVYRDKGFNELTYDGSKDYSEYIKEMVGNQATKAYSDTGQQYVSEISNLYDMGAKTIITSGFNSSQSFSSNTKAATPAKYEGIWQKYPKYKEDNIVMLDDNILSNLSKNAISVEFNSNEAGFQAGVAASMYITDLIGKQGNTDYKPSIALWGGLAYPTVFSYLSGFEQGVNWFDYQVLGYTLDGDSVGQEHIKATWDQIKSADDSLGWGLSNGKYPMSRINITNAGDINANNHPKYSINYSEKVPPASRYDGEDQYGGSAYDVNKSFYTGGFTSDPKDGISGSNAYRKIKNVNNEKDAIMFPVAGGQTTEALANLNPNSKTMLLVSIVMLLKLHQIMQETF